MTLSPTRRSVLLGALGAGTAAAASACSSGSSGPPSATPPSSTPPPSKITNAAPQTPDWAALKRSIAGELKRPGQADYQTAYELYQPRFSETKPMGVVSAANADDVATAIDFATKFSLPLAIRSGGHSYIGASTSRGLVVDLRPMNKITVSTGSVTIGGGALLIDVYAALASQGLAIPAGSCPSVGLSGLMLGGGIGVLSRMYGLTCDQLTQATVVTADGQTTTASATKNADLFFALRGGGGSFAAVTEMTLKTQQQGDLGVFSLSWDWAQAAAVLGAWQTWCNNVPDAIWSTCHLLATEGSGPPTVSVAGVCATGAAEANSPTDQLISDVGSSPNGRYLEDRALLDTMLLEAGCDHETVASCHLLGTASGATVERTTFVAASDLFSSTLPTGTVAAVVAAIETRQNSGLGTGGVAFDALGGAVSKVADDATAFAHRSSLFGAQWSASWPIAQPGQEPANAKSLAKMRGSVNGHADGAYSNYPTAGRANAAEAYWGTNLPRLKKIKQQWDPNNVFNPPQGITPA